MNPIVIMKYYAEAGLKDAYFVPCQIYPYELLLYFFTSFLFDYCRIAGSLFSFSKAGATYTLRKKRTGGKASC